MIEKYYLNNTIRTNRVAQAIIHLLVILAVFFSGIQNVEGCSTFVIQDREKLVVGKNFDFHTEIGAVNINHRHIAKYATFLTNETPVKWVSKYGSITFNQLSREFPFGGMNETGLVVEIMWLEETEFPKPDNRLAISELQWIQYQLDNSSSVDDVIKSDSKIRISQSSPVHFLVADHTGKTVTVEFIKGKAVFHTGQTLPFKVLTNNTYENALAYLKTHKGFGGTKDISNSSGSRDRFVRAAQCVKDFRINTGSSLSPVDYAFKTLSSIAQDSTVWSIVYDIPNECIYFKTKHKQKIKTIRMSDFNFRCEIPAKSLNMNTDLEGDVTGRFVDYTDAMNREMIFATYKSYRANNFPTTTTDSTLEMIAKYPGTLKCQ